MSKKTMVYNIGFRAYYKRSGFEKLCIKFNKLIKHKFFKLGPKYVEYISGLYNPGIDSTDLSLCDQEFVKFTDDFYTELYMYDNLNKIIRELSVENITDIEYVSVYDNSRFIWTLTTNDVSAKYNFLLTNIHKYCEVLLPGISDM